jgi:hypothetical protein
MVECVLVEHVVAGLNPVHSAFGRRSDLRRTKSAGVAKETSRLRQLKRPMADEGRQGCEGHLRNNK